MVTFFTCKYCVDLSIFSAEYVGTGYINVYIQTYIRKKKRESLQNGEKEPDRKNARARVSTRERARAKETEDDDDCFYYFQK